jgi:hypothetical protein
MATTERITTAEQLFCTPNLGRCELVRGELIMMSPAGARHGAIAMRIAIRIGMFVEQHRLGTVYSADTGFYIERDPDSVRAPDVAFVAAARAGAQPGKGFFAIRAAKPQEGLASAACASCACGTPIAKLSGPPGALSVAGSLAPTPLPLPSPPPWR